MFLNLLARSPSLTDWSLMWSRGRLQMNVVFPLTSVTGHKGLTFLRLGVDTSGAASEVDPDLDLVRRCRTAQNRSHGAEVEPETPRGLVHR